MSMPTISGDVDAEAEAAWCAAQVVVLTEAQVEYAVHLAGAGLDHRAGPGGLGGHSAREAHIRREHTDEPQTKSRPLPGFFTEPGQAPGRGAGEGAEMGHPLPDRSHRQRLQLRKDPGRQGCALEVHPYRWGLAGYCLRAAPE